jgi:hypothetical protein
MVLLTSLLLVAALQVGVPLAGRTAPNLQQASGVTATVLGNGTDIYLYDFNFEPEGSIDQQTIPESMLVRVLSGSFVFYIPEAFGDTIYFQGGEAPIPIGSDCELPFEDNEYHTCTFDDVTQPNGELSCTVDPLNDTNFACTVNNRVGILVQEGTTLVLPGPTECFVCKLDAEPGELEVAVAASPDTFAWWIAVNNPSPSPEAQTNVLRLRASDADPCNGRVA